MKFNYEHDPQPVIQREMPFLQALQSAKFVDDSIVDSWGSYREAVLWCWEHRPHRGLNDPDDQSMFARNYGVHAPHMSRYVNEDSKAPMDMKPDMVPAFEAYTGWRGISQYMNLHAHLTTMEEIIARREAA